MVVLVGAQLSMLALYLPPVFKSVLLPTPPQTIISLPVHTAVWALRPSGTFVLLVAVQVIRVGIVSPAGVQTEGIGAAPDDHFTAGPHCGVENSGGGRIRNAGRRPTVRIRIVSPASIQVVAEVVGAAPDDHFAAGPHCGVPLPGGRCIDCSSCGPSVRNRIVSAASV